LIADGIPGDKATKQHIRNLNILSNGTYYLRVEAAGQKDYAVVITRNARFDTGRNQTRTQAMNIQRAEAALGVLACESPVFVGTAEAVGFPPEILVLNPEDGNVINRFLGPPLTNSSDSLSLAHDGTNLWIAGGNNGGPGIGIFKVDPQNGTVLFGTNITARFYRGMAHLNGEIFLLENFSNIYVYDAVTFTLKRTLTQPSTGFLRGIEGDRHLGVLWAVSDRYIYKLDPLTAAVLDQSGWMPDGIAESGLAVGCGEIYVSERSPEMLLAAYDIHDYSLIRKVPIPTSNPILRGIGGYNPGPSADWFETEAFVGDVIDLRTYLPSSHAGEFENTLDPAVELYDPTGSLIIGDDNSAPDGTNVMLTHTSTLAGVYAVRVFGTNDSEGEVVLSLKTSFPPEADSDGDCLTDLWELFFFNSRTNAMADEDSDGDNMSNLAEFTAGTHPWDAHSHLKLSLKPFLHPDDQIFEWPSVTGRVYDVFYSTNLLLGSFEALSGASNLPATPPRN
ncbi:MAG: hypothetical protein AAF492_21055, partial [Verrucomicrobiota bacterium]